MAKLNSGSPVSNDVTVIKEAIATLEDLINSGATSVSQDGQTVAFDQDKARKRLRELKQQLAVIEGTKRTRPKAFNINLR